MKYLFKKVISVLASALMLGSTIGMAAAVTNYPAPFVVGGAADAGIVVTSGSHALSASDRASALDLGLELQKLVTTTGTGTTSITSGGDSIKIERSADKFNLENAATTVFVTSINKDHLKTLLADGTYSDKDNDEFKYTQKIELFSNLIFNHFLDDDYKTNMPSLGFNLSSGKAVLNYTIDFTTNPNASATKIEATNLPLIGKKYYVLDFVDGTNKTTLLDSATEATISEGEEKTLTVDGKEYKCSISYVGSTEVRLKINDLTTNSLAEGGTQKLETGVYVGIKDIMYVSKDTGISKLEFSIGKGKLELNHGESIKLNDNSITEILAFIEPSTDDIDKIVLAWVTDDKTFLASDKELVMPGFGNVKFTMGSVAKPKEENIVVKYDGSTSVKISAPIKDGTADFNLLYTNATGEFTALGKDTGHRLVTGNATSEDAVILFNDTLGDEWFVASWNTTTEAESYLLKFVSFTKDTEGINRTTIRNVVTSVDVCKELKPSDTCTLGNAILTISDVLKEGDERSVNFTINAGGSFQRLYTKEGLAIYLPFIETGNATLNETWGVVNFAEEDWYTAAGHGPDSFWLFMAEEDKDGNLGNAGTTGKLLNITIDDTSADKVTISDIDTGGGEYEIGTTDNYESYVPSDLATKVVYDTGGNEDWATITYHGSQIYADVWVAAPAVTVTAGTTTTATGGTISVYKDTEEASWKDKNLIVVGGSCVNTAARKIVDATATAAVCGADFSTKTGVGAGKYIIKVVESPYNTAKVAMLVAGYEAEDTVNAVNKIKKEGGITDKGTSNVYPVATA